MAERGARPKVPVVRRFMLRAVRHLFSPLRPDDYLELINPLWTTRELRGRVERVEPASADSATVVIRPQYEWFGHEAGQYVRLGVVLDGVYYWRAYSLTSDPDPDDGLISVTPKLVESGTVSPYLVRDIRPGDIVRLGEVEGTFTLPDPLPDKLLFISAGSGITPIISMLRSLDHKNAVDDVVVAHSARSEDQVMFDSTLRDLDRRHDGFRLVLRLTGKDGRLTPDALAELCPDWREREVFASGPGEMLDQLVEHWNDHGDPQRLHMERFQPVIGGDDAGGEGGEVHFSDSDVKTEVDGGTPILVAGENAGLTLPFGCRIGICHTCVGTLKSGRLRDLRTGDVVDDAVGQAVRTCVHTAEGDIEIEL
ncbi:ferredoxin reductase [Rhodococcus oxybenzonivorans]|uniref:ferredoxin reductase n=1 Tax=Rhodococcus oxybenzonivorans TaxID=1990687 RepID=UPI002952C704|nr:ferredoxin reductase [Rhodococcus oxybenzonivorans]MDV7354724.1 ferredoxin reductase [Rhodococcus oxybenzonivorans]